MTNKTPDPDNNADSKDTDPSRTIKDSAQQIWLAGLGAFARAQKEGGKVFEALVKEGGTLQRKTQAAAEERFSGASEKMASMASDMHAKAGQGWDKFENIFEDRVARTLGKLGVPSSRAVDALSARIDELEDKLQRATARARAGRSAASRADEENTAPAATRTATAADEARQSSSGKSV